MPGTPSSGRTCGSACQEPRLQSWWLPLVSLSHCCPWGCSPRPSCRVASHPLPHHPAATAARAGRAGGHLAVGSRGTEAPAAQERPSHITGNQTAACKLTDPSLLSRSCSLCETLEIVCCNRAQLEQCLLILVFLLWCNSWGGWCGGSDALPVTCTSALLSGMIQLQLFCGSNTLILFLP